MERPNGRPAMNRRRLLQSAAAGAAAGLLPATARPAVAALMAEEPVFSDDFASPGTIDIRATDAPGYKWYPRKWFSTEATRPENINVANSVLTLGGRGGEQRLTSLSTAIAVNTSPYARGTVFGRGGYFEARIAFDYSRRPPGAHANPAFWSMAVEHVASQYASTFYTQWPGQPPGYAHYIELDFMEHFDDPRASYVCSIHDWSGTHTGPPDFWDHDITNANNIVTVGAVDWNQFHTYSCYWVPQNGATPGHAQWFFDGIAGPTTNIYWDGPVGNPPLPGQAAAPGTPARANFTPDTPAKADRTYAILDQQHLALTLTTDSTFPMRVDWVRVWGSQAHVL